MNMVEHGNDSLAECFISGSIIFGMISSLLCWWFPYGAIIGLLGATFGVLGWFTGRQTGRTLVGIALSACGGGASILLAWDYWMRGGVS